MSKRKKWWVGVAVVLTAALGVGGWAYFHWLGFTLRDPQPVDGSYELPMTVVAGDGTIGFADGADARFHKPIRLAPFGAEAVLVADIYNHALRVVNVDGTVTTLAGGPERQGHRDGPADQARFDSPHGVAVRADGAIAVAEAVNHTVRLLVPEPPAEPGGAPSYAVSTLAGVPGEEGFRDGAAGQALFSSPHAVAWGADGSLFIADIGNARLRQWSDGVVTTLAGTGSFGRADGPLGTGRLQYPMDLCVAPDGAVLVADAGTGLIRRFHPATGLSTPWVTEIAMPHGLAVDGEGGLVLAEMYGHRVVQLTADGRLIRLCGTDEAGPGPDQLEKPAAVLLHAGRLWIADLGNHRVVTVPWPPGGG